MNKRRVSRLFVVALAGIIVLSVVVGASAKGVTGTEDDQLAWYLLPALIALLVYEGKLDPAAVLSFGMVLLGVGIILYAVGLHITAVREDRHKWSAKAYLVGIIGVLQIGGAIVVGYFPETRWSPFTLLGLTLCAAVLVATIAIQFGKHVVGTRRLSSGRRVYLESEPTTISAQKIRELRYRLSPDRDNPLSVERFGELIGVASREVALWERSGSVDERMAAKLARLSRAVDALGKMVKPEYRLAFFEQHHPLLLNLRPIDLLDSEEGAQAVIRLLEGAEAGAFA